MGVVLQMYHVFVATDEARPGALLLAQPDRQQTIVRQTISPDEGKSKQTNTNTSNPNRASTFCLLI